MITNEEYTGDREPLLIKFFESHKGKNVWASKLKQGRYYILKKRDIYNQMNYNNPYELVQFVGYGPDAKRGSGPDWSQLKPKIKNIKSLNDGIYLHVRAFDTYNKPMGVAPFKPEIYLFGLYEYEGSAALGSGATPVSFYETRLTPDNLYAFIKGSKFKPDREALKSPRRSTGFR